MYRELSLGRWLQSLPHLHDWQKDRTSNTPKYVYTNQWIHTQILHSVIHTHPHSIPCTNTYPFQSTNIHTPIFHSTAHIHTYSSYMSQTGQHKPLLVFVGMYESFFVWNQLTKEATNTRKTMSRGWTMNTVRTPAFNYCSSNSSNDGLSQYLILYVPDCLGLSRDVPGYMYITQYGSTVYIGIAMVYPHWKPYIRILFIFTFIYHLLHSLHHESSLLLIKKGWSFTMHSAPPPLLMGRGCGCSSDRAN